MTLTVEEIILEIEDRIEISELTNDTISEHLKELLDWIKKDDDESKS